MGQVYLLLCLICSVHFTMWQAVDSFCVSQNYQGKWCWASQQIRPLKACSSWLLRVDRVSRYLCRLSGPTPHLRSHLTNLVQTTQAPPSSPQPHQSPSWRGLLWIWEFNQSGPAAEPDLFCGGGDLPGPDTPYNPAAAAQPLGDT